MCIYARLRTVEQALLAHVFTVLAVARVREDICIGGSGPINKTRLDRM